QAGGDRPPQHPGLHQPRQHHEDENDQHDRDAHGLEPRPTGVGDDLLESIEKSHMGLATVGTTTASPPSSPLSCLPNKARATGGKATTDSRPALTSAAPFTSEIRCRRRPISVAVTMNGRDVACSSAAATAPR